MLYREKLIFIHVNTLVPAGCLFYPALKLLPVILKLKSATGF